MRSPELPRTIVDDRRRTLAPNAADRRPIRPAGTCGSPSHRKGAGARSVRERPARHLLKGVHR
jgi:hypothetical protein